MPKKAGPEFTDGFSKLQHGQPPIIETMAGQPRLSCFHISRSWCRACCSNRWVR